MLYTLSQGGTFSCGTSISYVPVVRVGVYSPCILLFLQTQAATITSVELRVHMALSSRHI
ncbi:MAG: hypothetical protein HNEKOMLI_00834 [Sodalis sp. Psp]|nr:hypothetical protein [Sodalis sp. Psp]MCR3757189.1 hypothetical protein [Sodalis sp. Ppy]